MAREVVIVDSVRTALTKAHRGSFNLTPPVDQLAHTFRALLERSPKVDPEEIGDVITGCGMPEGCQGMNTSRIAAMAAGLPVTVAATTVNRFCSSGSQAIMMAAHAILHEGVEIAIGAGVETITMMQDGTQNTTRIVNEAAKNRFPGLYFPMGVTAEVVAERYKVSREDQDRYALQSQQRYAKAQQAGWIAEEIAPMKVRRKVEKKGETPYEEDFVADRDECNRPDTTLEGLAKLQPAFKKEGGTRHGGQRVAALRRSVGDAGDVVRPREAARPHAARHLPRNRRRGLPARRDGNRPDLCGAEAAQEARPHHERHRPRRAERGLRIAGAAGTARPRDPEREAERERRVDLDRPPVRNDGVAPHGERCCAS